MRINNVIEIMAGSVIAIVLVSILANRSSGFNSMLRTYQGVQ